MGKKTFESLCWRQKISQFVTVSNKALALLMFENNYKRWTDMGKNSNWKFSSVQPKYTSGGNASQTPKIVKTNSVTKKGKKGASIAQADKFAVSNNRGDLTCSRFLGWSLEGIRKYNLIFDAVKAERASAIGNKFDEAFLEYSKKDKEENKKKQKKDAIPFEACRHELWDISCNYVPENIFNQNTDGLLNNYRIVNSGNILSGSASFDFNEKDLACDQGAM